MDETERSEELKSRKMSDELQNIEILEQQIVQSRKNYNNVAILLQHTRSPASDVSIGAKVALCRVFVRLLSSESMSATKSSSKNDSVVSQWLYARYTEYWAILLETLRRSTLDNQKQCLRLSMQILKMELADTRNSKIACQERLATVVESLMNSQDHSDLQFYFIEEYASKYTDILSAAFRSTTIIFRNAQSQKVNDFVLNFLQHLDGLEPQGLWNEIGKSKVDLKREQAEAWIAMLSQDLTKHQRKVLLELIPSKIAPCVQRPERLLDFITDSLSAGGSTPLLALSGLFELIKTRNLDYPHFYRKVYSLLDPFTLHSKHRSRFLRLLEVFLTSSHLPAVLIASFIKRLSRLCLFAPPSATAVITPMIYNLLKSHPSCTFMIHRQACCKEHMLNVSTDPFSMDEEDPMETGALDSSLWEIYSLQSHYNPNVATICKIISEQFTKPAFNLEDFLDHSYASMLDADLSKTVKKEPVVEYMIPKTVFPLPAESQAEPLESPLACWNFGR